MGFFDFFGKKKRLAKENEKRFEYFNNMVSSVDFDLKYSDGTDALIKTGSIVEFGGKFLKEIQITYFNTDKTYVEKKVYVEPHISYDLKNNAIDKTLEYFKDLEIKDYATLKGFFTSEYILNSQIDYIGTLGKDSMGRNIRVFDTLYYNKLKDELNERNKAKIKEEEAKKHFEELKNEVNK